jgi:Ca2+-binding EF-hand superfamily protein
MDKTSSDAAGTSGSLPGNKSEQVAKLTAEQRQILRDEKEREAEINDAFGYHDLKRQGKLSLNHLDDVLSMLGITLPPNEKRTPLLRLADPAGTVFLRRNWIFQRIIIEKTGQGGPRSYDERRRYHHNIQTIR